MHEVREIIYGHKLRFLSQSGEVYLAAANFGTLRGAQVLLQRTALGLKYKVQLFLAVFVDDNHPVGLYARGA